MCDKYKFIIIGSLAGITNGLFGTGGGLFIVPLLIYWIKIEPKQAFATSLAIIFPISIISAIIYYYNGNIDFSIALPYLIGGAFGGIVSGFVFKKIPTSLLRRVFAVLLIYGGIRALFFD